GPPATSEPTAIVLPEGAAPSNETPPTITGEARQGQTLSEVHGTWTNNPTSYTYQWLQCDSAGNSCTNISGAEGQTYVPVEGDAGHKLRVQETASNAGGPGQAATSEATAVVLPLPPSNTGLPTISGTAKQGQTLSEVHGT